MNLLQNVAITGRECVGSVASVNPHYSVLSGLPLVSFSSLIMSKLIWDTEERKTRKLKKKKNPAENQQTKKFHKPWSRVGWVINIQANVRNSEDGEGGGGKQVGEARVREG